MNKHIWVSVVVNKIWWVLSLIAVNQIFVNVTHMHTQKHTSTPPSHIHTHTHARTLKGWYENWNWKYIWNSVVVNQLIGGSKICSSAHPSVLLRYISSPDPFCGPIVFNATSGILQSPDFPFPYPEDLRCVWMIQVPNAMVGIYCGTFRLHDMPVFHLYECLMYAYVYICSATLWWHVYDETVMVVICMAAWYVTCFSHAKDGCTIRHVMTSWAK